MSIEMPVSRNANLGATAYFVSRASAKLGASLVSIKP
jgi:hypothetical protein